MPKVRADVFPAIVVVAPPGAPRASSLRPPRVHHTDPRSDGSELLQSVRVIVTDDTAYIYQDSADGPVLVFRERLAEYTPPPHPRTQRLSSPPREASLTTDSGKTMSFRKSGGCGCGSRLKTFNPFTTQGSKNDA